MLERGIGMPRKTFVNKITSQELTSKINPENIELAKKFLKDKSIRTSAKTIIVYESNLNIFFVWNLLNNENKSFTDIKKLEFSNFFSFASEEMKMGSSRLNNMRSTLSSLSNFVEKFFDTEFPNFRNVILKVVESSPKETRREKTVLTDEQIEDLLQYLSKTNKQQACWIALAITSGARFSELLAFETDLIDENRMAFGDLFLETTRQIKTKGRGKSGKLLYKYILRDKFLPYYHEWLPERDKILKEKKLNHNFLFIKQDGMPATPATIRCWVEDFEKHLKVPFYSHSLRHYLTTLLSRKNIPYTLIKEIFGWNDLSMVSIYDDSSAKDRNYPELDALKGNL
jgi:site-specific recombinase XerD